jgi:hypothetical protein
MLSTSKEAEWSGGCNERFVILRGQFSADGLFHYTYCTVDFKSTINMQRVMSKIFVNFV